MTRDLDAHHVLEGDLLGALGREGFAWLTGDSGIVTAGIAARVAPPDVERLLAGIESDDTVQRPGTGPVAFGALPFDPADGAELVVPARVVGRAPDGRAWVTMIGAGPAAPFAPGLAPGRCTVTDTVGRAEWRDAVTAALDSIARDELEKVVLARAVLVEADQPFHVPTILHRLRASQPGCFVHAAPDAGTGVLVGASPELLVRRTGRLVESRPMAGTAVGAPDALTRSAKDASEHRFVVDAIIEELSPRCDRLDVAGAPSVVSFGPVSHLVTPLRGTLATPAPSALELARRLHPTPAVAGTPTDAALAAIRRLEPRDRGRYAGPVGWVDARGDGEWALALRGAELDGSHAVLRAGAGIVAGSQVDAEWHETEAKLRPMLGALAPA